jgi:hypothetical protein
VGERSKKPILGFFLLIRFPKTFKGSSPSGLFWENRKSPEDTARVRRFARNLGDD